MSKQSWEQDPAVTGAQGVAQHGVGAGEQTGLDPAGGGGDAAIGTPLQAMAIMERGLAETGTALMRDDFDGFAAWIGLPYTVISAGDTVVCTSQDDLRQLFAQAREYYAVRDVAQLVRVVRVAAFTSPDHLRCTYETNLLSPRNQLVGAPHLCLTDLRRAEGRWQVMRSEYDLPSEAARAAVLAGKPG